MRLTDGDTVERESRSDVIPRRSLHDELVERLREMIRDGTFAPGEKIQEKALCAQFGVSRTPLREALKVLASEGSITLLPRRGAIVAALSVADLEDVFPVIGALESLAGEIACRRITDAEIADIAALHKEMVRHWQRRELQPYFTLNQAIHLAILSSTRNETLKAVHQSLASRLLTARYHANMSEERWRQAVKEHEVMLKTLKARDGRKLASILNRHLANKLTAIKTRLTKGQRAAEH